MGREGKEEIRKWRWWGGKGLNFKKLKNKGHVGSETAHPNGRTNIERRNGRKYKKERESACKTKHRKKV